MIIKNFGEQPISKIIEESNLTNHDIFLASTEQITHKMVAKARRGRRLSSHLQVKICNALNNATKKEFKRSDLFNYK